MCVSSCAEHILQTGVQRRRRPYLRNNVGICSRKTDTSGNTITGYGKRSYACPLGAMMGQQRVGGHLFCQEDQSYDETLFLP